MTACFMCISPLPLSKNINVKMGIDKCFNFCLMFFGVSKEYVVKRDRKRERIQIRQMSMYACCIFTNNSLKEVGQHFGGYDHTTIIHAKNTINDLCDTDEDIKDTFANLKDFIIKSKEKFAK